MHAGDGMQSVKVAAQSYVTHLMRCTCWHEVVLDRQIMHWMSTRGSYCMCTALDDSGAAGLRLSICAASDGCPRE